MYEYDQRYGGRPLEQGSTVQNSTGDDPKCSGLGKACSFWIDSMKTVGGGLAFCAAVGALIYGGYSNENSQEGSWQQNAAPAFIAAGVGMLFAGPPIGRLVQTVVSACFCKNEGHSVHQ